MVIVSHPTGNTFSAAVVEAFYEKNLLSAFYTSVAWKPDSFKAKLVPASLRRMLERRARVQLPDQLVHTRPLRDMVRNIAMRAGKKHWVSGEHSSFSVDGVYRDMDSFLAKDLKKYPQARAVYAYEDGALQHFREAKKRDILRMYDLPIGYWRANRKISSEEAEMRPAWKGTLNALSDSDEKCARKDEELELADTVIVPSNFVKNTLDMFPGQKKIIVNPFGVPANISSPRQKTNPNEPLRVLYVGSLTQRKGIAYLFEAIEKAGNAVTLTVIGRKVGQSDLLDKYCQTNRWLPSVPHSEILAEMRRHDVFVFPSLFEGLALVQGEAISQGLPVITTPNSGGDQILRDGIDGFFVPIRDPDAITARLLQLHTDRDLLLQMSEAARNRASELHWQGYKERTLAAYYETLGN